jgi:hypothetical protein
MWCGQIGREIRKTEHPPACLHSVCACRFPREQKLYYALHLCCAYDLYLPKLFCKIFLPTINNHQQLARLTRRLVEVC